MVLSVYSGNIFFRNEIAFEELTTVLKNFIKELSLIVYKNATNR